jgi:hypothetical protein
MGLRTTGFSCRASRSISSGIRATSNGSAASKIAMRSRVFSGLSSIYAGHFPRVIRWLRVKNMALDVSLIPQSSDSVRREKRIADGDDRQ